MRLCAFEGGCVDALASSGLIPSAAALTAYCARAHRGREDGTGTCACCGISLKKHTKSVPPIASRYTVEACGGVRAAVSGRTAGSPCRAEDGLGLQTAVSTPRWHHGAPQPKTRAWPPSSWTVWLVWTNHPAALREHVLQLFAWADRAQRSQNRVSAACSARQYAWQSCPRSVTRLWSVAPR